MQKPLVPMSILGENSTEEFDSNESDSSKQSISEKDRPIIGPHGWPIPFVGQPYLKISSSQTDTLLPFQLTAAKFMQKALTEYGMVYNACEMRLGKTLQTIAVLNTLYYKGNTLIVCPAVVRYVWAKALEKYSWFDHVVDVIDSKKSAEKRLTGRLGSFLTDKEVINLPRQIVIVSYQLLVSNLELFKKFTWMTLIGDEAHAFKNPVAQRTNAFFSFWEQASFKIALSGTPFQKSLVDAFTFFHRVNPAYPQTYAAFGEKYCYKRETQYGTQYRGKRNQDEFNGLQRHFLVRYTRESVEGSLPQRAYVEVDLPPEYTLPFKRADKENKRLSEAVAILEEDSSGKSIQFDASTAELIRMQSEKQAKGVADFVEEFLEQDVPAVIFAHHRSTIELLATALKRFKPLVLNGQTKDKAAVLKEWELAARKLIIVNYATGSLGINLSKASDIFCAEMVYDPSLLSQAFARCDDVKRKNPVTVYTFLSKGSVMRDVQRSMLHKAKMFKEVLSKVTSYE